MHALWAAVFSNAAPVEVEIGPGTGSFLLAAAQQDPETNFFAIEHSRNRAAQLERLIVANNLANARVLAADASCVVAGVIPPESVTVYHIYFPDPWWKRRHHRRRLFTSAFATAMACTLVPTGRIHVATDVGETFALALQTLGANASLRRDTSAQSLRLEPTTFEHKGLCRGATIKEATFVRVAA